MRDNNKIVLTFGSNQRHKVFWTLMVKKLPLLFDIFSPSTSRCRAWTQTFANSPTPDPTDCAISHSWCGKMLSSPPVWRSKVPPKYLWLIAEHSMCHPGNPLPQGLCRPANQAAKPHEPTHQRQPEASSAARAAMKGTGAPEVAAKASNTGICTA